ncbi:MAG TPA: polysaccharide deacetylase family protein, partial [Armatimonadota bacterium]|nr:polysaccharide deacetylase family protein [Armatimonadota bacterium]
QTVDYLVWQILGSKEAIEVRTGEPVRFFCFPVGYYDSQAIEVLRALQFWGAVVTEQGVDHSAGDLYTLRRVRVRGEYGAWDLALAIEYLGSLSAEDSPCTMTP